MRRLPVLFAVLVLGLAPTVIQAGSRQEQEVMVCANLDAITFSGEFLDASSDPNSDAVVVRYRFTFPSGVYLPMRQYSATMFVSVETGQFSLELAEEQSGGQAEGTPAPRWGDSGQSTAVRVNPESATANDALVPAGEPVSELNEGDTVFHDGGVYRYVNTREETSTLLVTVIVPQSEYDPEFGPGSGGNPDHEEICPWCEQFLQYDFGEEESSPTSAKLLPAIQCGGG